MKSPEIRGSYGFLGGLFDLGSERKRRIGKNREERRENTYVKDVIDKLTDMLFVRLNLL
jgi:hypothetical protein